MHIRLLAVGDRQPAWVDDAFESYTARFPREWRFTLETLPTAKRSRKDSAKRAIDTEGQHLLDKIGDSELIVLLDERGTQWNSESFAQQLLRWQGDGRDLAFVIGGPDGVSAAVRSRAALTWSLTKLTLPHGLARVLYAEQLYRAWSLSVGHPYHRS